MTPCYDPPVLGAWLADLYVSTLCLTLLCLEAPSMAVSVMAGWGWPDPQFTLRMADWFVRRAERAWACHS